MCVHSPWAIAPQAVVLTNTLTLSALVGCGGSSGANVSAVVTCLRSVSAAVLAYAQYDSRVDSSGYSIPFQPVLDGVFLPLTTNLSAPPASALKKPVIIGVNRNEGMYFLLYKVPMFYNNLTNTPDEFSYADLKVCMYRICSYSCAVVLMILYNV